VALFDTSTSTKRLVPKGISALHIKCRVDMRASSPPGGGTGFIIRRGEGSERAPPASGDV